MEGAAAVASGVQELLPVLKDRAQETEDRRQLSAETVKSLAATGFFRLLQPARFGGFEADPLTFLSCVRDIASACGSTGWVSSIIGVHNWQLALFPDQAQQDVWGEDPGTLMSSSYALYLTLIHDRISCRFRSKLVVTASVGRIKTSLRRSP